MKSASTLIVESIPTHSLLKPGGRLFIEDNEETPPTTASFELLNSRRLAKLTYTNFQKAYEKGR